MRLSNLTYNELLKKRDKLIKEANETKDAKEAIMLEKTIEACNAEIHRRDAATGRLNTKSQQGNYQLSDKYNDLRMDLWRKKSTMEQAQEAIKRFIMERIKDRIFEMYGSFPPTEDPTTYRKVRTVYLPFGIFLDDLKYDDAFYYTQVRHVDCGGGFLIEWCGYKDTNWKSEVLYGDRLLKAYDLLCQMDFFFEPKKYYFDIDMPF